MTGPEEPPRDGRTARESTAGFGRKLREPMRAIAMLVVLVAGVLGCGERCAAIASRRDRIARRSIAAGPHAEVWLPFERVNEVLAELVRDEPVQAPLEVPALGMLGVKSLVATATSVRLVAAREDRLRFAMIVAIAEGERAITGMAVTVEIEPVLRAGELLAGFGPDSLRSVRPQLDPGAEGALGDAVARWLPYGDKVPRAMRDRAAGELASYLTGKGFGLLRDSLLKRLGEVTTLRVRLPALPIARTRIRSEARGVAIEITTTLPVRQGIATAARSDDITVRISASTAAELANWSIANGYLPRHYTRGLDPKPDGEYTPVFDYVAGARRPAKLYLFQDRGGCSYFGVGMAFAIAMAGDKLRIDTRDRLVEDVRAAAPLEAGLWVKQLIQGPVDRSYRAAARTEITGGGRRFATRIVAADARHDEIDLALRVAALPRVQALRSTIK